MRHRVRFHGCGHWPCPELENDLEVLVCWVVRMADSKEVLKKENNEVMLPLLALKLPSEF